MPVVNLRSQHRRGQSAFSPAANREPGRPKTRQRTLGGIAAPGVRGAAVATPTACAVTAPAAEAGRADRCSTPSAPPQPGGGPKPPPRTAPARLRVHHLSGRPARLLTSGRPGQFESQGDEGFTGGWAPRRRCRCSRSPARSAHAPGRCPLPRRSPPSWLEAEEPARRGAERTAGASGTRRERGGAGKGAGRGRAEPGRRPAGAPPIPASRPWHLLKAKVLTWVGWTRYSSPPALPRHLPPVAV